MLPVTMVTRRWQVAGAAHVNVTKILTCRTQNLVMPALESVSNAFFTLTVMRASIVVMGIMETPGHKTAEVSGMVNVFTIKSFLDIYYFLYLLGGSISVCGHLLRFRFRLHSGCMCNPMGTSRHSCADGLCDCDRVSGQCQCLPGVEGHQCDRCAPDTWNINSGKGCQPCQCHPQHSYSSSCDLV